MALQIHLFVDETQLWMKHSGENLEIIKFKVAAREHDFQSWGAFMRLKLKAIKRTCNSVGLTAEANWMRTSK